MKKWEYCTFCGRMGDQVLNTYGLEGWELVACTMDNGWCYSPVFKREITEKVEE